MDFTIAIPSYKRPTIFKNKTFKLLEKHNVNYDNVILFLRDEEEKECYGELPFKVVLTNCDGIKDTRNFLQDYFYNNKQYDNVLYIDDDIDEVLDFDKPLDNLIDFVNNALDELKEKNLYICSIVPFSNKFFLRKTTTLTLKYIMGGFRIERIRRDKPVIYTGKKLFDMMKKLHIIVLVVALIVFFIAGFTAAISVVLGAMCVSFGIIFSAPIAYKAKGTVAASKVVTDALKGELVKILTIVVSLAGIFIFITAIVPIFIILGLAIAAIFSGIAISKVDIK